MFGLARASSVDLLGDARAARALPRDVVADRRLLLPEPDVRAPLDLSAVEALLDRSVTEPSLDRIEGRLEREVDLRAPGRILVLQIVPYAFPGDSAITGQGRLFALHMFDAQVVCESHVTFHDGQGGTRRVTGRDRGCGAHRSCDPIVHLNIARALCRQVRLESTVDGPRPVAPIPEDDGGRPPARRRDRGVLPGEPDLRRLASQPLDQDGTDQARHGRANCDRRHSSNDHSVAVAEVLEDVEVNVDLPARSDLRLPRPVRLPEKLELQDASNLLRSLRRGYLRPSAQHRPVGSCSLRPAIRAKIELS